MYKTKYRINEKGKKRITIGLAIIVLLVILIFMFQYLNSSGAFSNKKFDSAVMGKAILANIEKQDKKAAAQAAAQANAGVLVPGANPEVGDFFNNSLFIGDSRMQGLMIYSGVTATGYTEKGLDVKSANTKPIIFHNGTKMTIPEALKLGQKFDKIVIKLGINELGWRSTEMFKQQYGELVAAIKSAQPEAKIYVMGILPVTAKKNGDGSVYNNPRIAEFNSLITAMTAEQGVAYLDVGSKLANAQGFLPDEASSGDGIHLNSEFCKKWLVLIKNSIEEFK